MKGVLSVKDATKAPEHVVTDRAVKLIASSIYKQLQSEGCDPRDIISISSQLIDMVTSAIKDAPKN